MSDFAIVIKEICFPQDDGELKNKPVDNAMACCSNARIYCAIVHAIERAHNRLANSQISKIIDPMIDTSAHYCNLDEIIDTARSALIKRISDHDFDFEITKEDFPEDRSCCDCCRSVAEYIKAYNTKNRKHLLSLAESWIIHDEKNEEMKSHHYVKNTKFYVLLNRYNSLFNYSLLNNKVATTSVMRELFTTGKNLNVFYTRMGDMMDFRNFMLDLMLYLNIRQPIEYIRYAELWGSNGRICDGKTGQSDRDPSQPNPSVSAALPGSIDSKYSKPAASMISPKKKIPSVNASYEKIIAIVGTLIDTGMRTNIMDNLFDTYDGEIPFTPGDIKTIALEVQSAMLPDIWKEVKSRSLISIQADITRERSCARCWVAFIIIFAVIAMIAIPSIFAATK